MLKQAVFKITGMSRDLAASAFNSKFAYENKNIRIMPTDIDNTLLSIINEKGTKEVNLDIKGIPIGQATIDNSLILFTTNHIYDESNIVGEELSINNISAESSSTDDIDDNDKIYKIDINEDTLKSELLYSSNLNFNTQNPIETLAFYENELLKKVYWVDGRNQPRVINIAETDKSKWNNTYFDFTRRLKLNETISISKNTSSSGSFPAGVIQYAFTYFNKYGQESNIFNVSPLYYISPNDIGASPEDSVSNSFSIDMRNLDTSFDYIRVYSILRTSINSTPEVRIVSDISISSSINFVDNGTIGSTIDPTELLYIGGEDIIAGTIAHKDNTLFLGDISLNKKVLNSTIRNYFKGNSVQFKLDTKVIEPAKPSGTYPYDNQLKYNSYQIKTFKYLEWYRLGIQAQHYTGKWSEPIWINDVKNNVHIQTTFYNDNDIQLPIASFTLNNPSIINELINNNYIRIRPVIVYPTINDRECICQGVLCPTVYNVSDRKGNSPFAQSSWFSRPNSPFDMYKSIKVTYDKYKLIGSTTLLSNIYGTIEGTDIKVSEVERTDDSVTVNITGGTMEVPDTGTIWLLGSTKFTYTSKELISKGMPDFNELGTSSGVSYKSKGAITMNRRVIGRRNALNNVNLGFWAEFRHNYPIPDNREANAEIQCIVNPPATPLVRTIDSEEPQNTWISNNGENYYIDQSIITLHSPDIEFNSDIKNMDLSNVKLRIVGMVPFTSNISDISIQVSTPQNTFKDSNIPALGFYKEPVMCNNISNYGWRGLTSGAFWFDEVTDRKTTNSNHNNVGFIIYPWHRNGSLNNTATLDDNGFRSAMLDKKKMSNLKFSYKTQYLDSIWNAYELGNSNKTGISGAYIFDSNELTNIRIKAPINSGLNDINYYGNIDKIININRVDDKSDGYPIVAVHQADSFNDYHNIFAGASDALSSEVTDTRFGYDPVRIKYKSTPHVVMALNYTEDNRQIILPTIYDNNTDNSDNWSINHLNQTFNPYDGLFWEEEKKTSGIYQETLDTNIRGDASNNRSIQYGFLWLGELYNDSISSSTRFGGQSEEAFENNLWVPCGEAVSLLDNSGLVKNSVEIKWTEGDTYYQRYDHLKTYPFTLEDQNSITDIISFMCETRVNIDGRYDRNRGQSNNLVMTPENFNKVNDVYTQSNNFFNYRTVNPNKLNLSSFRNTLTWSKTKTLGELTDTWTNITLASSLDLDGDKGKLRALKRYNNELFAFQDKGISNILYNSRVQITASDGTPIEIANSGKVEGKRYITDRIGCTNKWSICETPNGLYFIDDITKGIFLFNGKLDNISDRLGFHSWINSRSKSSTNLWDPINFNNFVSYYDKVNGDVFFISKDECLAFSEPLNQFTSFYSYEDTPYFVNLEDKGIFFRRTDDSNTSTWLHNEGEYNYYFGKYQPFYTTIIANPESINDKTFSTVEFRADTWNSDNKLLNISFDNLETWNEYQDGVSKLVTKLGVPSNLKRKFRIWRAIIPRDKSNNRDRMRNPWLYVKMEMKNPNNYKTLLQDITVTYF